MTELAAALRLDYGTLTPMLKRLESFKVVLRTRTDNDERIVRVSLTEKGRAMKSRVHEVLAEIMASTGKSGLELAGLIKQLDDIREQLEKSTKSIEATSNSGL